MVLSIAHMSMVIFPIIFYIFHMSGVKKTVKNKKNILEPRLVSYQYGHLVSDHALRRKQKCFILLQFFSFGGAH